MENRGTGKIGLGLMSGSSLDGVDVTVVRFAPPERDSNQWFEWVFCECYPYPHSLAGRLKQAQQTSLSGYFDLETELSEFYGDLIARVIADLSQKDRPQFAGIHGHTVFHRPDRGYSLQMGRGAIIAQRAGIPLVLDFRNSAVAANRQGAPMVPILEQRFSEEYPLFLNLGGIANLSVLDGEKMLGWDVCGCNQLLNFLAGKKAMEFDRDGVLAAAGKIIPSLLKKLNEAEYLAKVPPKSLSNEEVQKWFVRILESDAHPVEDAAHTVCQHISDAVAAAVSEFANNEKRQAKMMVSGGGVHHPVLMELLKKKCATVDLELVVPEPLLADYKEALLMAYMAWLRLRGEPNFLPENSGDLTQIIGGGVYLPSQNGTDE